MQQRGDKVTLSLEDVRSTFEQQQLLSMKDTLAIIHEAHALMNAEPNMVVVHGASTYVFGDIHGQFYDLMQIIDDVGIIHVAENDVKLVFLGDYVDRGAFSCEVMLYLLLLKATFPTKVYLLRGNHECETISSFYGFRNECQQKYGISVYQHFLSCFQSLPIAALLQTPRGAIFCVHGGLSPDVTHIDAIDCIDRHRELPTDGALCDLLWSDPAVSPALPPDDGNVSSTVTSASSSPRETEAPQWTSNEVRGCSYYFSPEATFAFLAANNLLAVVRAHEYAELGFLFHFTGDAFAALDTRSDPILPPLITIFSAANYCDKHGNLAGYLIFHSDPFAWEIKQLEAAAHPAPPLPGASRTADIWKQFRQTLPFLPASKNFFDDILVLARTNERLAIREKSDDGQKRPALVRVESSSRSDKMAATEDPSERRRRQTSEMHPQAIRRVLDAEASKWIQSDDGSALEVFPPTDAKNDNGTRKRQLSLSVQPLSLEDRSKILSYKELETIKLIFALIDTDGNMELSDAEISTFIFNVLGERVSRAQATKYLEALDFDHDNVVDFADILSWAAVMKMQYEPPPPRISSSAAFARQVFHAALTALGQARVHHVLALLFAGALARDWIARRASQQPQQLHARRYVRLWASLGLLLFVAHCRVTLCRWTGLTRAFQALTDLKRKLLPT